MSQPTRRPPPTPPPRTLHEPLLERGSRHGWGETDPVTSADGENAQGGGGDADMAEELKGESIGGAAGLGAFGESLQGWIYVIANAIMEGIRMCLPFNAAGKTQEEEVATALRQLPGSYLTTWLLVHSLISLRQALWRSGSFVGLFSLYWLWLVTLIIALVVLSSARCLASVIPIGPFHSCAFANMTQGSPYFLNWTYQEACVDSYEIRTVVPVCGGTQQDLVNVETSIGITTNVVVTQLIVGTFATIFMIYILKHRGWYLAKKPGYVLRSLCRGLRRGTFMVSYSWAGETLVAARSVANLFDDGKCWVDVQNILPGASIQDICSSAAAQAQVGFVFITPEYLASQNCCLELLNFEPASAALLAPRFGWTHDSPLPTTASTASSSHRHRALSQIAEEGSEEGNGEQQQQGRPLQSSSNSNSNSDTGGSAGDDDREGERDAEGEEDDAMCVSDLLKRKGKAAKLIVFVTDEAFDEETLDPETIEFNRSVVRLLQHRGHYVTFERDNILKYLNYRPSRVVLEALINSKALLHSLQSQEITPAVNEGWLATSAAVVRTVRFNFILMAPIIGAFVAPFQIALSQSSTAATQMTQQVLGGLYISAYFVAVGIVMVWLAGCIRGTGTWLAFVLQFVLFPFYRVFHRVRRFSSLPDVAHLTTVLTRFHICKRLAVFVSPTAPSDLRLTLKVLQSFKVVTLVDDTALADFSFVCLDKKPPRHFHRLLKNADKVEVDVPPVLDASGATVYWTTASYPAILKHKPKNVRKAFIKCGAPPKLETVLVQMMKRGLGLPLRAGVTVGKQPFKHIDFEIQSAKKRVLHTISRSAVGNRVRSTKQQVFTAAKASLTATIRPSAPQGTTASTQEERAAAQLGQDQGATAEDDDGMGPQETLVTLGPGDGADAAQEDQGPDDTSV